MKARPQGFLLLPVLLLLSMVAAAAYLTQREGQLSLGGEQAQEDADKARAAAEAGLNKVAHEAHLQGCYGDYPTRDNPTVDTAFDGARYSAYASEKDGSPFNISAEGRYGDARVMLTRNDVVMHRSAPQTMVLQPGATGQDTSLRVGSSTPDPDALTLTVQPNVSEALMAFDLTAIPKGSHVTSAQLTMRMTDLVGSGSVGLHRVQSPWTEAATATSRNGTAPWVQSGGDAHASPVASTQTLGLGWLSWSITDLVDGWVKGRFPNHGLLLRGSTLESLSLASSDYPTAALRPRLVVTFYPPCGWTLPTQKQTLAPVADATLSESTPTLNDGASGTLRLQNSTKEIHVVLLFDTSSISPGKTIRKATLRLTFMGLAGGVPNSIDIYGRRNNESWNESSVTWKKRDATQDWDMAGAWVSGWAAQDPTTVSLPKDATPGTVVEIDAKDWVTAWVNNSGSNYGAFFRLPNTDVNTLAFGSRESLTMPPQLIIEYE